VIEGVKGLGITTLSIKCQIIKDKYKPGFRVSADFIVWERV
jgi:hypothetical protein